MNRPLGKLNRPSTNVWPNTDVPGQDAAGHLHLKHSGHAFEDGQARVLEREDRWVEAGVKDPR